MSENIYYKISVCTVESDRDHFYKYIRYVFFRRLIFTIDIYPHSINFGVMWAYSSFQRTLWRLS